MNRLRKIGLFSALSWISILGVVDSAFALEELMTNYRGVRSQGMGGVVTTTGKFDEALFGNPASAAFYNDDWKVTILGVTGELNSNMISDISDFNEIRSSTGNDILVKIAEKKLAGRNEHVRATIMMGFYSPKLFGENTGLSFALLFNSQNNIMLRSTADVEMQALQDAGPVLGIHHRMLDSKLALGLNARALYRLGVDQTVDASDFLAGKKLDFKSLGGQGVGVDFDLGAMYELPVQVPFFTKISVGGSLNNLMQSTYHNGGTTAIKAIKGTVPGNDRTGALGARLDLPEAWLLTDNLFSVEFNQIGKTTKQATFWKKLHMGGETRILKRISVRGGFNQGYPSAGLGFDLPVVKIDFATYGEELGPSTGSLQDRRYSVKLAFEI